MTMLIMQRAMASSVKGSIPKTESAKEYYEFIAQRFKVSEKSAKSSLLNKLTDMKYDGQGCVRAHIMNMIDIGAKLQELNMTVDEDMMVHFALNSLPKDFKPLRNTYIAQKESWTLNDLITISVEIEDNLIRERGAKVINMVQAKQHKWNKNSETNKQKEKDNSSALKPVGNKCFFCKKGGHMKKECRRYKRWLDKQKAKGVHKEEAPKQG
ncbi:PREDICTED: uncharacterized protein LOC103322837 [Prunus mume]|uniref:Uncharacterized protein LOC103322584 n=1 Tax=Prunus mume TaxID=102107 RepID=A0ABM0NCI2_PRUMU|nr:PREDICTED: uncharacterized protein LOC103322584 [Prunus mume]XP_008222997.1 PREDICTED: uncharacterized protein LOC103322837 [Prunus mume]